MKAFRGLLRVTPAVGSRNVHQFCTPILFQVLDERRLNTFLISKRLMSSEASDTQTIPQVGVYTGEKNAAGQRHGQGVYKFADGVYKGAFHRDYIHGKGKVDFVNGDTYEGDFEVNTYHGLGIYKYADGGMHVGEYENGVRSGGGIFNWKDGSRYVGKFLNNMLHGQGFVEYSNGDIYSGQYHNGVRQGNFEVNFANGDRLIGSFENNLAHGVSEQTFANGDKLLINYDKQKKHGVGEVSFADGDRYVGMWSEDECIFGYFERMPYKYTSFVQMIPNFGWDVYTFTDGSTAQGRLLRAPLAELEDAYWWFFPTDSTKEGMLVRRDEESRLINANDEVDYLVQSEWKIKIE